MKPDYQSYSLADLYDVQSRIDKDTYPERYEELLKEIADREKHKSEVTVDSVAHKPKRKRSNKEKIASSLLLFIAVGACIFYGHIPGKHGGFSMENDPYIFWGLLLVGAGLALNQLLTLETKSNLSADKP